MQIRDRWLLKIGRKIVTQLKDQQLRNLKNERTKAFEIQKVLNEKMVMGLIFSLTSMSTHLWKHLELLKTLTLYQQKPNQRRNINTNEEHHRNDLNKNNLAKDQLLKALGETHSRILGQVHYLYLNDLQMGLKELLIIVKRDKN